MNDAPFHAGEVALQAQLGVDQRLAAIGRSIIREHMPDQHRELFTQLPTLLVGAVDPQGQPWATMLAGAFGFISSPDARTLRVGAWPAAADPVAALIAPDAPIGLLGLQPHTRRRNRMNGRIGALNDDGFTVQVQQSFGNCPKYIQAREPMVVNDRRSAPARVESAHLSASARTLIAKADTLFIATASSAQIGADRAEGVDVSHRGGLPGFVKIVDDAAGTRLVLPDYQGNLMFNTLGNLHQWPHAGLLFVDPATGDMLQLAVSTTLQQQGPAQTEFAGAQRLLHCRVTQGWWRAAALPLTWSAPQYAPQFARQVAPT
ncbi:pyridoxamine 5'-phosphate oxidase family protein [Aquabacterium sp.]|uniref:pyridoxamine 5'-phosphate oxidase family protein n=1 Tax=Aquabacterium sp. TaxID=1872578 RepID=UPI002BD24D69|nr:pyridoxamine 5'-phosphate oxidase family protein [Aquabacterium sp.]HSW03713.1 pyridoxamine 5'-phosphate oxidase family protein [Aquabacterium sp.]